MRDTTDNFATATTPATAASSAGRHAVESPEDRRRSPRAPHRLVINIHPVHHADAGADSSSTAGAPVSVILVDLSLVGMGVIHSAAMRHGDRYQIPLTRGGGGGNGPTNESAADRAGGGAGGSGSAAGTVDQMALFATVVRCEQLDDGLFNIGFEFNSSADTVDEGSRQLTGQPALRD